MTSQEVMSAAKQGNPQAIAALMNRSLQPKGITAKAKLTDGCLHVMLESATIPNQAAIVPYVTKGVKGLGIAAVKSLVLYGRIAGEDLPTWTERIELVSIVQHYPERFQTVNQEEDQVRCPNCASTQIMATKKGFGAGEAAIGAVLLGPIGLAGGMVGANTIMLSCLKCGHQWNPIEVDGTLTSQVDKRVTQTRIKKKTILERIGLSVFSVIGSLFLGLFLLIIPILGWLLGPVVIIVGVLVIPHAMISGDPNYVNNLIGECPHCRKEVKTSMSSNSFDCSHCKKRIIVRDRQFYNL